MADQTQISLTTHRQTRVAIRLVLVPSLMLQAVLAPEIVMVVALVPASTKVSMFERERKLALDKQAVWVTKPAVAFSEFSIAESP